MIPEPWGHLVVVCRALQSAQGEEGAKALLRLNLRPYHGKAQGTTQGFKSLGENRPDTVSFTKRLDDNLRPLVSGPISGFCLPRPFHLALPDL